MRIIWHASLVSYSTFAAFDPLQRNETSPHVHRLTEITTLFRSLSLRSTHENKSLGFFLKKAGKGAQNTHDAMIWIHLTVVCIAKKLWIMQLALGQTPYKYWNRKLHTKVLHYFIIIVIIIIVIVFFSFIHTIFRWIFNVWSVSIRAVRLSRSGRLSTCLTRSLLKCILQPKARHKKTAVQGSMGVGTKCLQVM